ncbi:uncharacterized protein K444DRAFT_187304 [Hyaloscypha bicolor E]|uniref:Uncharacterized protein n=1 Tax=Hyaloscypha bicolor E TaxID=1095630 RepID=A0A2J6SPF6_9HELO|nr:uncharacterized protein K444DRAFT_187304 [Hyaloscypha bicolor E]PMD52652.1 hypothetical protein K444DRAFT_187304 [Hyaloscypha bicolor E]
MRQSSKAERDRQNLDPVPVFPLTLHREIRGLSKKLIDEHETWTKSIDEHETWTGNFRDPWNEALPVVNPICPFLTNRIDETNYSQQGYTGMRTVQEALKHHQQCWRRPPPSDDNLCFHVTFYELVDLTHDDELEGEIWRSGKLHSDNPDELEALYGIRTRRIRESACTIVVVPDPAASQFWTMLYMCPNGFELYDKSNEFEHYDMVLSAIKGRDAEGALEAMVGFSIRMVLQRWEKILEYFTWLLGHRDSLSDPDAHDSLLFDDDSFSRSRRYFWAINYLAELDISISRNIIQLDRFIGEDSPNKSIREQLNQLQHLRERILGQRDEAIALRDGLFSASGVMESRASTRLNENIKLLTFSVWSVNNTIFSLKALIIVATLVGLSTYLLVFNLNNVVELCSRVYRKRKLLLIELMQKDLDKKWKETGQKFTSFQPKQEKRKPSEWMLGLFVLHKAFGRFQFIKRLSEEEKQEKIRSNKEGSMPYWPDLPLPEELAQSTDLAKVQSAGAGEVRKKPSIRDRFARLSMVFRRGAVSPGTTANV